MTIHAFTIESAISFSEAKWINEDTDNPAIQLVENDEYKYLAFFPQDPDREHSPLVAMCSKDGKTWTVCVGATKNGEKIDLPFFRAYLEEHGGKFTNNHLRTN